MVRLLLVPAVLLAVALAGCDDGDAARPAVHDGTPAVAVDDAPAAGTPVEFGHPDVGAPDLLPGGGYLAPLRRDPPVPRVRLRVAADGCTVVRESVRRRDLSMVSWTVVGADGSAVFGEPAAGHRRFHYHRPGPARVQLRGVEAGTEKAASRVVRVRC